MHYTRIDLNTETHDKLKLIGKTNVKQKLTKNLDNKENNKLHRYDASFFFSPSVNQAATALVAN